MKNLPAVIILALLTSALLATHLEPTLYAPHDSIPLAKPTTAKTWPIPSGHPLLLPSINKQVFAFSGLKLRTHPGLESKVLTVIPYGKSVELIEQSMVHETIEWMSGHWVKVKYGLEEGYVFEGFISDLPVPTQAFELSDSNLEIMTPLLSWAEHHYPPKKSQSLESNNTYTVKQTLKNGHSLIRKDSHYSFKVSLKLVNTELDDGYNLLRSLLKTAEERVSFENKTVFIANNDDYIDRIRIELNSPATLKEQSDGSILITITDYQYGCDIF